MTSSGIDRPVMVVEDEFIVALDIQDCVEAAGLEPIGPYATIKDALRSLEKDRPICAVLDVQLKDGEVFPVADRLYAMGIPFVFHSGHANEQELLRRYPGARFCSKPSSPETLQRQIESLAFQYASAVA